MHLWSDYEGRTIAEAYPLKKLVRPEGRSAFFLTTNGTGTPSMVRLIEAHFDEPEILARWRAVSEIKQENLVVMRKFGETVLDGTPLVYAVMEPTEMSLADLLQNRTLTLEESKQLAASLIAAVSALHARGLVHEHIEPANILAAGETVKLRSDCVREVEEPEGTEADVARRKASDAHALAVVLLEAMTGRRTLQGSATLLPSPFDGIIRNGLSGKWGISEMSAALGPVALPKPAAAPVTPQRPAMPKEEPKEKTTVVSSPAAATPAAATPPTSKPTSEEPQATLFEGAKASEPAKQPSAATTAPTAKVAASPVSSGGQIKQVVIPAQAPDVRHRIVKPVEESDPRRKQLGIAVAAILLLLVFFGWRMMRNEPAAGATSETHPAATQPAPPSPSTAAASAPRPSAAIPSNAVAPTSLTNERTQWRVVAFTYNHQGQAQQKADDMRKQHPSLTPEVFSPTGRAPYLVTIGGPMTRNEAESLKRKARGAGLPRDLYAQNFTR